MTKIKPRLGKWIITKTDDGSTLYTKKTPSGRTVITVEDQYDEFAKQPSISIRYFTRDNGKWGEFVADAICDMDIANVVVKAWLEKKGYDYE